LSRDRGYTEKTKTVQGSLEKRHGAIEEKSKLLMASENQKKAEPEAPLSFTFVFHIYER